MSQTHAAVLAKCRHYQELMISEYYRPCRIATNAITIVWTIPLLFYYICADVCSALSFELRHFELSTCSVWCT